MDGDEQVKSGASSRWFLAAGGAAAVVLGSTATIAAFRVFQESPLTTESVTVRDSAGIRIVYSGTPGWQNSEGWIVEPEPIVTIGAVDEPTSYVLHRVTDATRLKDGTIAVVNNGSSEVRVFSEQGEYLRAIGQAGDGPGELRSPYQVQSWSGDSIAIFETGFRINWFEADGTFLGRQSIASPVPMEFGSPSIAVDVRLLPDLGVLAKLRQLANQQRADGPVIRPLHHALRLPPTQSHPEVTRWDTIMSFPGDEEVQVTVQGQGVMTVGISPPHSRRTHMTFGGVPSRVCIGTQESVEIRCFEADGSQRWIRWAVEPVRVTGGEIAAWQDQQRFATGDNPVGAATREGFGGVDPPEFRPPYGQIFVDEGGNLWVETPGALDASAGEWREYRIFDAQGAWLGEIKMPPLRIFEIGERHIIGLHRDALGVEYVQVFALLKK